jgi:hypothetical protein
MAKTLNLTSPVKVIASNTAPTTDNLKKGEFAYGVVSGVPRLFGNPTGNAIVEFSNYPQTLYPAAAAVSTGKKWITGADIYQRCFQINCNANSQVSLYTDGVGTGQFLTVVPELTMLKYADNSGTVDITGKNVSGAVCLYNPWAFNTSSSSASLRNNTSIAITGILTVYFTRS